MSEYINKNIWKILFLIVIAALIAIIVSLVIYNFHFNGNIVADSQRWGAFGDYFGGMLNPILSFLALIFLMITIILQNNELKISREELKLSREAQEKSVNALKEQAKILEEQLQLSKRASNAEYFFKVIENLQREEIRSARRKLFQFLDNPTKTWLDADIKNAEIVCQSYDLVGILIRTKFVDEKAILSRWHFSIKKSWKAAEQVVMLRRKKEGADFWKDFEWLNQAAQKYS